MQYIVVMKDKQTGSTVYVGPYRSDKKAFEIKDKIVEAGVRDEWVVEAEVKPLEPWLDRS